MNALSPPPIGLPPLREVPRPLPLPLGGDLALGRAGIACAAAAGLQALGGVVVLGWALDSALMTRLVPGLPAMAPSTAIAFILAGVALCAQTHAGGRRATAWLLDGAALGLMAIGGVAFAGYLLGRDAGLDRMLFGLAGAPGGPFIPARMAPATAANFWLLGAAIGLRGRALAHPLVDALVVLAATVSLVTLLSYGYVVAGSDLLYWLDPVALPTALGFLLLAVGLLATHPPGCKLMQVSLGDGVGGRAFRRLAPSVMLVPALIGWGRTYTYEGGVLAGHHGVALTAALTTLLLITIVWWTSAQLDEVDEVRRERDAELVKRDAELRGVRAVLDTVFARAAEAIAVLDSSHRILGFNAAFAAAVERFIGPTPVIGASLVDLAAAAPEKLKYAVPSLERALAGESFLVVRHLTDLSGEAAVIELTYGPTVDPDGTIIGTVQIIRDVTERVRAEEALQRLNAELERRVEERTASLTAATREMETFTYSVSHDLRQPLRALDGFSQALLEDYAPALDATGKDYLARLRAAAQKMGALIDALLVLSRATRTEMDIQRLDLSAMAAELVAEHRRIDPERQVAVRIAPDLAANGDPRLVRALLQNLIANAWKYTSHRPDAHIELGATVRDGERWFFVRDDGAGFDMAYVDKLFKPFQRLHGADEFTGLGIGLATVQRIVARHGGAVRAEGVPGQGATFWFTLPAPEPQGDPS